jgi:hypothetical protein
MIDVTYELYTTPWSINQKLSEMVSTELMSFDISWIRIWICIIIAWQA